MKKKSHSKGGGPYQPETLALGYGYDPTLSEGSVKPPVFLTSTFQFESAEEGKRFFELAYDLRPPEPHEDPGLIYSRLNNPNLQIFEERMAAWDGMEQGAVFSSGMAAISTMALALLKPGDVVLRSAPVYGGTHYLFKHILPEFGIQVHAALANNDTVSKFQELAKTIGPEKIKMVYLETPANPSICMVDIEATVQWTRTLAQSIGHPIITVVDNTFLGPVFQKPSIFDVDLVLYSATKFIGGHSDLIAGVITGKTELMKQIVLYRTILGTMANPFTGWLLLRSLETVSVRMRRQAKTALALAEMLAEHPNVLKVSYPGLLTPDNAQYRIYRKQCTGSGSLIAFEIKGGQEAAFKFLNQLEICRLAVSLGGTETLVEHPMTMTHADVPPEILEKLGVTPGLIRISVGLEHLNDLRRDIKYALEI